MLFSALIHCQLYLLQWALLLNQSSSNSEDGWPVSSMDSFLPSASIKVTTSHHHAFYVGADFQFMSLFVVLEWECPS